MTVEKVYVFPTKGKAGLLTNAPSIEWLDTLVETGYLRGFLACIHTENMKGGDKVV